jgi:hypothetical protein
VEFAARSNEAAFVYQRLGGKIRYRCAFIDNYIDDL